MDPADAVEVAFHVPVVLIGQFPHRLGGCCACYQERGTRSAALYFGPQFSEETESIDVRRVAEVAGEEEIDICALAGRSAFVVGWHDEVRDVYGA